jgi:hypothetical protein
MPPRSLSRGKKRSPKKRASKKRKTKKGLRSRSSPSRRTRSFRAVKRGPSELEPVQALGERTGNAVLYSNGIKVEDLDGENRRKVYDMFDIEIDTLHLDLSSSKRQAPTPGRTPESTDPHSPPGIPVQTPSPTAVPCTRTPSAPVGQTTRPNSLVTVYNTTLYTVSVQLEEIDKQTSSLQAEDSRVHSSTQEEGTRQHLRITGRTTLSAQGIKEKHILDKTKGRAVVRKYNILKPAESTEESDFYVKDGDSIAYSHEKGVFIPENSKLYSRIGLLTCSEQGQVDMLTNDPATHPLDKFVTLYGEYVFFTERGTADKLQDAVSSGEFYMYVLLRSGTLRMQEYANELSWNSKHKFVTGGDLQNVIAAGVLRRIADNVIYLDNSSGTFPSIGTERTQIAAERLSEKIPDFIFMAVDFNTLKPYLYKRKEGHLPKSVLRGRHPDLP